MRPLERRIGNPFVLLGVSPASAYQANTPLETYGRFPRRGLPGSFGAHFYGMGVTRPSGHQSAHSSTLADKEGSIRENATNPHLNQEVAAIYHHRTPIDLQPSCVYARATSEQIALSRKELCALGRNWIYTFSRREAKKLNPANAEPLIRDCQEGL